MIRKLAAVVLMAGGGVLMFSGLDLQAKAITCTPAASVSPFVCVGAHSIPFVDTQGDMSCVEQGWSCVAGSSSNCGNAGYDTAVAGTCTYDGSSSDPPSCVADAGSTFVMLRYWTTYCSYDWTWTDCSCWASSNSSNNQQSEVCNCL